MPPSFFTTYIERYPVKRKQKIEIKNEYFYVIYLQVLASQLGPRMVEHLPSSASHFKKVGPLTF